MLALRINIVPTNVKSKFLQIRINEDIKSDLQIVAELRGLSTSALIHSLIVKAIRAEKEREPKAFQRIEHLTVPSKSQSGGTPLINHEELRRENVPHKKIKRA